jgi:DNA repair photolyase
VESVEDGWYREPEADAVSTVLTREPARSIIARNESPDVPFDQSINPYRGCQHGCIYCFARPSHAYLGLSPGLDFETRIFAKPNAAELLRRELGRPGYRPRVIALGSNTDPYQQAERDLGITRQVLEVLARARHPVSLVTKSHLVTRDLDLLTSMAKQGLAAVLVSITTLDNRLVSRMEPRAASPRRRLEAIRHLSDAGVPCGVLASPMIPALNDHELEAILEAAAGAGAVAAATMPVRLPHELKSLFTEWLQQHYPHRAGRILGLIRQMRGGELNDPRFGSRMRGEGPYAAMMQQRFTVACRRLGLLRPSEAWQPDCSRFTPPGGAGAQMELDL